MPDFSEKKAGYAVKEVEEVLKILQMKQHNKRQAQYMAGHKYIPSTEMYEVQELESLTDALAKYHPFG
ncbi:MAG: integrase [Bacteroidetes bacterium]|nr:integrase [Bacteroidota bacterium]